MKLTMLMLIFRKNPDIQQQRQNQELQVKSKARVGLTLTTSTFCAIVSVTLTYALILAKVLFALILVWKGFDYENVNVNGLRMLLEDIRNALLYDLNCPWLGYMMYPFMTFFNILATINIDYGAVEVTCTICVSPSSCAFLLVLFLSTCLLSV